MSSARNDIRHAAEEIYKINQAIHDAIEAHTADGLKPADLVLLASAAELASDRAVIITDCCRDL